jgi:hypothetical protein
MPLPTDRHAVKIRAWVAARERAVATGDVNLARSITADLERNGYRGDAPTTAVPPVAESPDPPRPRRGRPPKVRPEQPQVGDTWPGN